MENHDRPHLPVWSWGGEIPPVLLLWWLWLRGGMGSSCLETNPNSRKHLATVGEGLWRKGRLSLPFYSTLSRHGLNFTHGIISLHNPMKGRAAATPAPSMGYSQRSWPVRGLCSKTPRLSQAGVSSWFCFKGIHSSLDVAEAGFVAFGRKHPQHGASHQASPGCRSRGQTLLGFGGFLSSICIVTSPALTGRKISETQGRKGRGANGKREKPPGWNGRGAAGEPGPTFPRCCPEHRPGAGCHHGQGTPTGRVASTFTLSIRPGGSKALGIKS